VSTTESTPHAGIAKPKVGNAPIPLPLPAEVVESPDERAAPPGSWLSRPLVVRYVDSNGIRSNSRAALTSSQTPRRQKIKKPPGTSNGNVSTKESMRALVDALDTSVLTPKVWIDLVRVTASSKLLFANMNL
jgi:hypothetical protein